ncbi:hypothetical protein EAF00_007068 [Botryotinia globosa]|nr:hypothetical protein EAF00_007068 [Botryotinia globosa]
MESPYCQFKVTAWLFDKMRSVTRRMTGLLGKNDKDIEIPGGHIEQSRSTSCCIQIPKPSYTKPTDAAEPPCNYSIAHAIFSTAMSRHNPEVIWISIHDSF